LQHFSELVAMAIYLDVQAAKDAGLALPNTTPYMKIRFFWCCDRTHKLSGSGLGPAEVPQSDLSLKAGSLHMNKLKFEF
jgi:hypothetical protein